MPITRKWRLDELLEAARRFPLRPRERLTFEYVLLAGVNDSPENAREVVALLSGVRAKVNLIALNPGPELPFATPSPEAVAAIQQTLIAAGIPTYLRRPRGLDIYAACGQLKRSSGLLSNASLAAGDQPSGDQASADQTSRSVAEGKRGAREAEPPQGSLPKDSHR
jgi:23S rRNA (adenine2503-C2)-methyltransferase